MIKGDTYEERYNYQLDQWAQGNSIHNTVDDQCCPDFSCCNKKMDTPIEIRKTFQAASEEQRETFLYTFLGQALGTIDNGKNVFIANGKDELTENQN
jgi:hypothetical protein